MRFLKLKIAKALEYSQAQAAKKTLEKQKAIKEESAIPKQKKVQKTKKRTSKGSKSKNAKPRRAAKGNNIMKNYARAMVNFALSPVALPYLTEELKIYSLKIEDFELNLKSKKEKIHCIQSLRDLMLVKPEDTSEQRALKIVFKNISEKFIKYFSVNWIFHSKLSDKMKYLGYRGKILRRVQNPEHFTYLESFTIVKPERK